jgi:hypothetical protein
MVRHRLLFQNDPLLNVYLSFPDDLFRVFVIAKRNEFGVSQMVGTGPLQKCYLSYGLGLQPDTLLHLLCGEPLAPSASGLLGKIDEGAFRRLQILQPFEHLTSRRRHQASSDTGSVEEIFASIEADHE